MYQISDDLLHAVSIHLEDGERWVEIEREGLPFLAGEWQKLLILLANQLIDIRRRKVNLQTLYIHFTQQCEIVDVQTQGVDLCFNSLR